MPVVAADAGPGGPRFGLDDGGYRGTVKAATASRAPLGPPPGALRVVHAEADRPAARRPVVALVALAALAAVGYGAVAQLVPMPLVNPDELRYTIAARAVVDGEWLNLRDHGYGYGAVCPLVLSPVLALSGSTAAAYPLFKLANAVLFASPTPRRTSTDDASSR